MPDSVDLWSVAQCPQCDGKGHPVLIDTDVEMPDGTVVHVERMLAYRCDKCGFEFYELHAGAAISELLEGFLARERLNNLRLTWGDRAPATVGGKETWYCAVEEANPDA